MLWARVGKFLKLWNVAKIGTAVTFPVMGVKNGSDFASGSLETD